MRTDCAVCTQPLVKRIRCYEDGPLYMHHKDVAAADQTFDSQPDYRVVMLFCVNCDLLYKHED